MHTAAGDVHGVFAGLLLGLPHSLHYLVEAAPDQLDRSAEIADFVIASHLDWGFQLAPADCMRYFGNLDNRVQHAALDDHVDGEERDGE